MYKTLFSRPVINALAGNVCKRNAGHSKWANIKHTKMSKDAERGRLFTKIGQYMKVAVIEGGSGDPKLNLKLEQAIEQGRRASMPAATIQSIIKSAVGNKSQAKTYQLEIRGPGSCMILVDVFTEHIHAFRQTLATQLKKHSSKYGDGGGRHSFEEKGLILTELPAGETEESILEKATDAAIECGAEDVRIAGDNEQLEFLCAPTSLKTVAAALEKHYKVGSAEVVYIPIVGQELTDEQMLECSKLLAKMEAMPEVVRIFDNVI